jgi:hypothetical protein
MATDTILLGGFTNCSAIAYGYQDISQVWFGNSLVWSATSGSPPPTSAWININNGTVGVAYTPVSNVYLVSATMVLDTSQGFNYLNGVWRLSGNVGIKTEAYENAGLAPVNIGTLNGKTAWRHSYVFAGTTVLSAGVTYLIHLGYNFADEVQYLNGDAIPYHGLNWGWAVSQSQTQTLTSVPTSGMYINVATQAV